MKNSENSRVGCIKRDVARQPSERLDEAIWRGAASRNGLQTVLPQMVLVIATLFCGGRAMAESFAFANITDLPGGPGQGNAPSINEQGDIAFYMGTDVYFYDRSQGTFLNLMTLPGAPSVAWYPKLNNLGNIAMVDFTTKDYWLFEADTQTFTNVSTLAGFPGNSQSYNLRNAFDLNDNNKMSFHSGNNNFGYVYVYDHMAGTFTQISGLGGGPPRGRENVINNIDQVGYMGFPSLYLYDPATGVATDISNLPGGPGGLASAFAINDLGDAAIFSSSDVVFYDASAGSFLYLSTLPGWPISAASSNANDLSDRGDITFWLNNNYYFDPTDQSFTQLTGRVGETPVGGMETSVNDYGQVAFTAGFVSIEDIFVATPLSNLGDLDDDGDIDLADFTLFASCLGGPGVTNPPSGCAPLDFTGADIDNDGDVDLYDFAVVADSFTG